MTLHDDQKLNLKTNAARDKAEVLLEQLREAKQQAADQHDRVFRRLNGQAPPSTEAIDKAIATTEQMIEQFNRQIGQEDDPKHTG
ncbi:MAG: hypothetical protein ACYTGQ_13645 [Planctomycetota bacterium]|jgi:hypothetical protein